MKRQGDNDAAEPWMRGTHQDLDVLRRAVVHALELAEEDVERWATRLTDEEMFARPLGLPAVAFHLLHVARSLDRLLTYAEDRVLDDAQLAALAEEQRLESYDAASVLREFREGVSAAKERVRKTSGVGDTSPRFIGRRRLPTTLGGLLIHCAEHTQRHSGQMVTTAKAVLALRNPATMAELVPSEKKQISIREWKSKIGTRNKNIRNALASRMFLLAGPCRLFTAVDCGFGDGMKLCTVGVAGVEHVAAGELMHLELRSQ